jgi:hypothetical protein
VVATAHGQKRKRDEQEQEGQERSGQLASPAPREWPAPAEQARTSAPVSAHAAAASQPTRASPYARLRRSGTESAHAGDPAGWELPGGGKHLRRHGRGALWGRYGGCIGGDVWVRGRDRTAMLRRARPSSSLKTCTGSPAKLVACSRRWSPPRILVQWGCARGGWGGRSTRLVKQLSKTHVSE